MLHIYMAPLSSPSNKVRYCVSALGLAHKEHLVDLGSGEHMGEAYKAINPRSLVPAIQDGDFALNESDAINAYLCRKEKSELYPSEFEARARVDSGVCFGSLHIGQAMGRVFFNRVVYKFLGAQPDENSLQFGLRMIDKNLGHLNAMLENSDFVVGDSLTLADLSILSALDPADVAGVDISAFSNVTQWRARLMAMKFYQDVHSHFGAEVGM